MSSDENYEVLKNPIRSLSDRKEYKLIKLKNGLKVLIVKSDKLSEDEDEKKKCKSSLAAVALCVGVGCFSDPQEVQGLSHFLEHMVRSGMKYFIKLKLKFLKNKNSEKI
jgi:nardilysin